MLFLTYDSWDGHRSKIKQGLEASSLSRCTNMGVSINGGFPKWLVYCGNSCFNRWWLGVPPCQETSISDLPLLTWGFPIVGGPPVIILIWMAFSQTIQRLRATPMTYSCQASGWGFFKVLARSAMLRSRDRRGPETWAVPKQDWLGGASQLVTGEKPLKINGHFRKLNWRYLPYIRPM